MKNKEQIINPEHSTTDLTPFSTGLHRLAKRLLGAKGFAQIELVKNWPDIVGETLSPYCLPLSLDFPSKYQEYKEKYQYQSGYNMPQPALA